MRFTLRAKLVTIVATAALAFVAVSATSAYLTDRMDRELTRIRTRFIPALEAGPRLEAAYEKIRRGLLDSVAAQDAEALAGTRDLQGAFLSAIEDARAALDNGSAKDLDGAAVDYYASARDVSRRLIAGETGEALVKRMKVMQSKQASLEALLKSATTLDRAGLVAAFDSVSRTQDTSGRILIVTSVACLVAVFLLSFALGRGAIRSLSSLSSGFARFGQGDFTRPIAILGDDELGDVAREANQMAERIRGLVHELESFSSSVAHDLRAPVRSILGFSTIVLEDHGGNLPPDAKTSLQRVIASAGKMGQLIDGLLTLSRLTRQEIAFSSVDLSDLGREVLAELRGSNPGRAVSLEVAPEMRAKGDPRLIRVVLVNLLGNAWKFTSKKEDARIGFTVERRSDGDVFCVRDNGAGFEMQYAAKLFGIFERLHSPEEFEGTGVGLATVRRIIRRHGGDIWAESSPGEGAAFYFTLRAGVRPIESKPA